MFSAYSGLDETNRQLTWYDLSNGASPACWVPECIRRALYDTGRYMRTLFSLSVYIYIYIGSINKWGSRYFIQLLFRAQHRTRICGRNNAAEHRFAAQRPIRPTYLAVMLVWYTHSVRARVLFYICVQQQRLAYIRRLLHVLELTVPGSSGDLID